MSPTENVAIKPRRIIRGVLFALGIPVATLMAMGILAVLLGDSPVLRIFLFAWLAVVVVAMIGVHDILWGYTGGTTSRRVARAFGSFIVGGAWLILLGKAAIAMTPSALSLFGK